MSSNRSNSTSAPTPTHGTAPGCGANLDPSFSFLCDMEAAWGIVVETLAALGLLVTLGLLLATVAWTSWQWLLRRPLGATAGATASLVLFLVGTVGMFSLTFAFVVRLDPRTCPTRVFLFGVLSALCFSALLSRGLALRGFTAVQGWVEAGLTLALSAVQVVVAVEWLLTVLVRDQQLCLYSQGEFVMLLTYVLCLLTAALCCSVSCLYHFGCSTSARKQARAQALLLYLTVMFSMAVWVVWVTLLTWGNWKMGRRPLWDDPVLSVALVTNAWILLGYGLVQAAFLRRTLRSGNETPLDFTGWTSPGGEVAGLGSGKKAGRENRSFESDSQEWRGIRNDIALRSPYTSGFSMMDIDPGKDYSIPRPQTTNTSVPYEDYYGHRLSS